MERTVTVNLTSDDALLVAYALAAMEERKLTEIGGRTYLTDEDADERQVASNYGRLAAKFRLA